MLQSKSCTYCSKHVTSEETWRGSKRPSESCVCCRGLCMQPPFLLDDNPLPVRQDPSQQVNGKVPTQKAPKQSAAQTYHCRLSLSAALLTDSTSLHDTSWSMTTHEVIRIRTVIIEYTPASTQERSATASKVHTARSNKRTERGSGTCARGRS